MLRWFARLVRPRGETRLGSPSSPIPAAAPPPAGPEGPPQEPAAADPFAPFAKALGVPVPPPAPEAAVDDADELLLADGALAHFRRNRPGAASAPSLSLRVLNLVASPGAEVSEMVKVVSADPALAAGVLQVANSAAYRGREEIETVRAAVVRLGLDEVARVAGAIGAKSLFNPKLKAELAVFAPRFAALYHRALTVANAAAFVALQARGGRSDRAFLGGMLADVGKSVALRSLAALHLSGEARVEDGPRVDAVLDRVHVEIGAECHQEWALPQYLTVIAVRHHDREIPADPEFADLHAIRLAAALLDLHEPAVAARAAREIVQSAGALGLSPFAVRSIHAEARDASHRVATAFGLEGTKPP